MQETAVNAAQTQQWAFILSQLFDWVMTGLAWIVPFQNRVLGYVLQGDNFWRLAGTAILLLLPAAVALDLDGLEISEADLDLLLTVDSQAWKLEADQIPEFFRGFGDHLPARLWELQQELVDRLG